MKGQLFSIDFVISFAIIIFTIGITLQTVDLVQKKANNMEALQSNNAETIADAIAANRTPSGFLATVPYRMKYTSASNNSYWETTPGWTGTCPKNTFTAKRIMTCSNAFPCSLEVRTCE